MATTQTVIDLIRFARRLLNIDAIQDSISHEEATEGLYLLNSLIENWNLQSLLIYRVENELFSLSPNVGSYTIGSGGTLNTTRPIRIESAFTRLAGLTNPIDYSMREMQNDEYQLIPNKNVTAQYPSSFMYNQAWPLATLYIFPIPSITLTLGLTQWKQIETYSTVNDNVSLPPGYEIAIRYNLAVALAPMYGKTSSVEQGTHIKKMADSTLQDLKAINMNSRWPIMSADDVLVPNGRYSIYSDRMRA